MARFFALGAARLVTLAATGALLGWSSLQAAPPPGPPATNAAPAVPVPPAPQSDFDRYGNILAPNGQPPYPFKLAMPLPDVGELKVPHKNELDMREKLERLTILSDAQILDELAKWPAFTKMSLGDEGAMLTRIQQFRDRRSKMAQMKAHQLGLLTLNPEQQARFEKEYWDKRLQMDRQLAVVLEPVVRASEQSLDEDLYREFSSTKFSVPPPKPPPPSPPASPPAPVAVAH